MKNPGNSGWRPTMRKDVIVLLAIVVIIVVTGSIHADTILYTRANSNLRAGPSTKHKIVKMISAGSSVRVGRLKGKWYEVLNRENEVVGYLYSNLLVKQPRRVGSFVGKWRGDIPGLGRGKFEEYTLTKDGNKYHLLRRYFDGSQHENILTVKNVGGETRYYKITDAYVDYYVIHGNGDLGLYDEVGQIRAITSMAEGKDP
jgi:hypothetical protein